MKTRLEIAAVRKTFGRHTVLDHAWLQVRSGEAVGLLGADGTDEIVLSDPGIGLYKRLILKGDRLTGAVLFGDTADGLWYLELIRSGASIESMREDLAFGRALAERSAPDAPAQMAA